MGGPQILAIVARRGRWYGVLHESLPNGRAGWIAIDSVRLLREPWEIVVDRSERRRHVRRGGREVDAFPVAVGRPGSPTPIGRFAVTDRLAPDAGSPYGCCILALSGRQTRLPPGWQGGDRLAIHGTTSDLVGGALSSGCVRVREVDLRRLMRRIPVGTRVTVRA
jgi:lipoprotein-anchoring transpeptidase ErfK/SrfK